MMLPSSLYSAAQVRALDRLAIEHHSIAGIELMTRAGTSAFRVLRARFPAARRIVVVCGPGNNGGDGFVVARLAKQAGMTPVLHTVGDLDKATLDAVSARVGAEQAGVIAQPFSMQGLREADAIVDALLGTGIARDVEGEWRAVIDAINASRRPVLAVDIPSGLNADTGAVMGSAVRARVTVSFIGLKLGLFTGAGREYGGEILFDDLDVPTAVYADIVPVARRLEADALRALVRRRARDAHKGSFGRVAVVGGGHGMPGAAVLCGAAALRAGAGLARVAVHPDSLRSAVWQPELLVGSVKTAKDVALALKDVGVVAVGPGLARDRWAKTVWRAALASGKPLVVDADALNLLSAAPVKRNDWILTPHPGEAARLLGVTIQDVQRDRVQAVRRIAQRFGGVCVLKGAGTLIASQDETLWLCDRGNPGLASGGTGDVLTGIIAGLRAQGLSAVDAARLGVWLHAAAGDAAAADRGEIGMLASDVLRYVGSELNGLVR